MIDLLIAGGGPAGLGTAILAAQAGMEAVVFEPRPLPLDKACGEGLMPAAVRALARLGVAIPGGRPFHGIRYVDGPVAAEGRFRAGPGLGVRRTLLHAALLARARALGVQVVEGRVGAFREVPGAVEAAGLRARWLVAADGLHSPIRRALGLEIAPRGPARYGIRRHFAGAPWTDLVEVHWAADAEAYVTPVADDLVGVAVLFSARGEGYDGWLARFPALRERLGAPVTAALGAGPFGLRARHVVRGRVLFAGDAAGFLDPITGEGVRLGLASAAAIVRCLRAGRPGDYEGEWRRLTRVYRFLTSGLLRLRRVPAARRRLVPALRRLPGLFDGALALLDAA